MAPFNNLDRIQVSTGHNQPEHFSKRFMLNIFFECKTKKKRRYFY
jgi:hypothetical protein